MYYRGEQRDDGGRTPMVRVPENYSGSAFGGGMLGEGLSFSEEELGTAREERADISCSLPAHLTKKRDPDSDNSEKKKERVLGSEEILLLGVLLLMSGGEFDGDILTLLMLLLL